MNANTEHNFIGYSSFLPGGAVLLPVVLALTLGVFYLWRLMTELALSSVMDLPLELVLPALVLPLLATFVVAHNERLWVFLSLLTLALLIFRKDDGKVKLEELFYSLFVLGGIVIWFAKEVFVYRRRIILTSFDFFFLTSWVLANSMAMLAFLMHQGDQLIFIKELLVQVTLLLYFPLRKVVRTRQDLLAMIGVCVMLGLLNGIHNALTYQQRVIESALEFGSVAARVAAYEVLSMLLTLISFTLLAYARRPLAFLAGAGGTAAGIAFVLMSLSRGPIVATTIGMLVVVFLVPIKRGIRLAVVSVGIIIFNLAALTFIAPTFASSILENITDRLATIDKLQVDKSLGSRVSESKALLERYIPASPVIGYGYGVPYAFYDAPYGITAKAYFIHNGYVHPLYKFGIPAGVFFIFMLFYPLLKGVFVRPPRDAGFLRAVMTGATACLLTILLTNLTSSKFSEHVDSGLFVIVFVAFDYVWRNMPPGTRPFVLVKR